MSAWINQIFRAGQVNQQNIVRRSISTVNKYASQAELEREVKARGFHMAQIGKQYVIVCSRKGQINVIC